MELHPSDKKAIDRTIAELESVHGQGLVAVALQGEAATGDYRPRKSSLDLVVVVDAVRPECLSPMRRFAGTWRRRRVGTPLVLDPPYLQRSFDVFPIEFIDILDRHRLLTGADDPFTDPQIDPANLRFEVEEHLRGKMLHLWEGYLRSGDSRTLGELLAATPAAFGPALRGLMYWLGEPRPREYAALVRGVEAKFDLELATFHRVERARVGTDKFSRGQVESVFAAYLGEVRALVRQVDAL
jgi:hypothetical protein